MAFTSTLDDEGYNPKNFPKLTPRITPEQRVLFFFLNVVLMPYSIVIA